MMEGDVVPFCYSGIGVSRLAHATGSIELILSMTLKGSTALE